MIEWFLFHTWPGERFLAWLDARGLAVVKSSWLGEQTSGLVADTTRPQEAEASEWAPSAAAGPSVSRLAEADN